MAKHLGMFVERSEVNVDLGWRFTIGKGYDDDGDEWKAGSRGPWVVNGHAVGELPPAVGAE